MSEEPEKTPETKSEDKQDSDLAQIQEQVTQIAPLVKPLAANALEWINAIPIVGGFLGAAAGFWWHQSIIRALAYFILTFLVFDLILPLRNSVRKRLKPYLEAFGGWLVDGGITRLKRDVNEIRWRYARKNQKFLIIQGENCQYDVVEGFGRGFLTPQLKDIFVPLQLALSNQEYSQKQPTLLRENQDLQIWHLLNLAKGDPTFRRILIKSDGGLGKTTLLRYITYSYANQQLRRGIPKLMPVFIRLREWDHRLIPKHLSPHPEIEPIDDLAQLIQTYIDHSKRLKKLNFPDNWAKNALESGQLLILWDGFDEVEKEWQNEVSEWLGQQMQTYSESYFILTSRKHWYDQNYSAKEGPRIVLYINEFNEMQIKQFILNWYAYQLNYKNAIDKYVNTQDYIQNQVIERTDNLMRELSENTDLRKLAKIPLNLNMIVNLHSSNQTEKLPHRRAELYQDLLDLQLIKRPKARDHVMILQEADRQKVLQNLALFMGENSDKQKQIEIDKKTLDAHIIASIQSLGYPQTIDSLSFIDRVVHVSEILFQKDQFYEFAHLTFQSYLMAKAINEGDKEDFLIHKIGEKTDWWRDTAKFYAALQRNPNPFLRRLNALNDPDATALAKECQLEISPEFLEPEFKEEFKQVSETINSSLYEQLETYLKNGQWKEADKETDRLMLQIVGKEADQWLSLEDIQNFPCPELQAIDKLWVDYSNGKFGFSVQKKVWMACGGVPGKYDWDVYKKFADQVGWRRSGDWLSYNELTFLLKGSNHAHLPWRYYRGEVEGLEVEKRGGMEVSFLAQRLVTCNISQI